MSASGHHLNVSSWDNSSDNPPSMGTWEGHGPPVPLHVTTAGGGDGITVFLENGSAIEMAQYMAGRAGSRTTKLYDRRRQQGRADTV